MQGLLALAKGPCFFWEGAFFPGITMPRKRLRGHSGPEASAAEKIKKSVNHPRNSFLKVQGKMASVFKSALKESMLTFFKASLAFKQADGFC